MTLPARQNESGDIAPSEPAAGDVGTSFATAKQVAELIRDVIRQQKLAVRIQGRDYVRCEGWTALGALMGLMPREVEVRRTETPQGYEAVVEVVRVADGRVLSRASAICARDEPQWRDRPEYAVRSMAVTRATSKAFRLVYSWVMALAGYEPTPAEEMVDVVTVQPAANSKDDSDMGKRRGKKPTPQKQLADEIVRVVEKAYPEVKGDKKKLQELCRGLAKIYCGTPDVRTLSDARAKEVLENVRDLSPDAVRLHLEVPF